MRVREKYVAACMQARGGRIGVWDTPKYEVEYGYTVHEGRKLFRARKKKYYSLLIFVLS
jgi:hypothetical protein